MMKCLTVFLLLLQTGCYIDQPAKFLPIDKKELKYKKGECLAFKIDSINYGVTIVAAFSKDEGGLWYGLLFTDYIKDSIPVLNTISKQRLFGRKIPSSFDKNGYFIGLNVDFVQDSCLAANTDNFKSVGILSVDTIKIKFGSQAATSDYIDMINSFKLGIERRKMPPEDYRNSKSRRTDEYFDLKDYLKD